MAQLTGSLPRSAERGGGQTIFVSSSILGDIRLWVGPRVEHLLSTWDLTRVHLSPPSHKPWGQATMSLSPAELGVSGAAGSWHSWPRQKCRTRSDAGDEPHVGLYSTGGPDVIRKEAWPLDRTISAVRLWWELEEPEGVPHVSSSAQACNFAGQGIISENKV